MDTPTLTPRPDGPQPTEQQLNEGPYTGRHTGGWKMKRALLAPADEREHGRHISMMNVHGTFFDPPKQRWFETHNKANDTPPDAARRKKEAAGREHGGRGVRGRGWQDKCSWTSGACSACDECKITG